MAIIIDGKELARKIRQNLKIECDDLKSRGIIPKLAVIMVGDNPASKVYVRNKSKACNEVGVEYEEFLLDKDISHEQLIDLITKLNNDKTINGILLQSPIPDQLDINEAFRTIDYNKDVDGFHPMNVGKLALGQDTFVSLAWPSPSPPGFEGAAEGKPRSRGAAGRSAASAPDWGVSWDPHRPRM